MFSKTRRSFIQLPILLMAGVLALTSCTLPVNQEAPKQAPPATKLGFESKCLKNVVPVMKGFIDGTASAEEVSGVWNCFGGALNLFYQKVKGSNRDQYSPRELSKFFEDYFLDNGVVIDDALLGEIMRFKQILIGGANTTLTRSELKKLMAFADEIQGLSLELLPYMKIFSLNWQSHGRATLSADQKFFNDANIAIQDVGARLGERVAQNGQSYEISHFLLLLKDVERLSDSEWPFLTKLEEMLPLVKKLKKSLIGGQEDLIEANEWGRFALLGSRGYIQYLRYYYFIQHAPVEAKPLDVTYLSLSLDDLFSYLGDMVRQKPGGKFTKSELLEITETLNAVAPNFKMSNLLLDQLMQVKPVIFGGTGDEFIPEEFVRAQAKVAALQSVAESAFPYLDLYLLKWKNTLTNDQAQVFARDGEAALVDFGLHFAQILEGSYDLNNLSVLAREYSRLFPETDPTKKSWAQLVDQYLPLVLSAKNLTLGDASSATPSVIQISQWHDLLDSSLNIYSRYIDYHFFLSGQVITKGSGLEILSRVVTLGMESIEQIINRRVSFKEESVGLVPYSELDSLVDAAAIGQLIPWELDVETVKPLLRVLLQKFLVRPELRLKGLRPQGLTLEATRVVKVQFQNWADGQRLVQSLYESFPTAGLTSTQLLRSLAAMSGNQMAQEFSASLNASVPLNFDEKGRISFLGKKPHLFTSESLFKMNLAREMVGLVNNAYNGDLDRIKSYSGINKEEANALYKDLKPFAVDLGLVDENNKSFANSRFLEANLFTPHADGSDLVSFREGVDLVMMILSGIQIGSDMEVELKKSCSLLPGKTPSSSKVPMRCFLSTYRQKMSGVMDSMPDFVTYAMKVPSRLTGSGAKVAAEDRGPYETMLINFLKATGWVDDGSGYIKLSDLGLVPHIMQYTETLMSRFDLDRNGYFDRTEALKAFPTFEATLSSVSGVNDSDLLEAAFTFILVHARVPQTNEDKIFLYFVWKNQYETWPVWADRNQLSIVLGAIADLVNSGQTIKMGL